MSECKYKASDGWCGCLYGDNFGCRCVANEDSCLDYEAVTNADRIRSMSDEELAVFMSNEKYDTDDRYITSAWWLKWLQQPCEGGADDA